MSKEQCYPCAQSQLKILVSKSFFTELSKELFCRQILDVAFAWFLGPRFPISVQLQQQEQHWQSEHGKCPWDGDTLTKPSIPPAGSRTRHPTSEGRQPSAVTASGISSGSSSDPQPRDKLNHQGYSWGKEKCLFYLHPSFFPSPSLLPHLNQSKAAGVESQVKEQKMGNVEKARHRKGLLIASWGSWVIIHTVHRAIETIRLLTPFQTLMKCISYTPTATWRRKKSKICWGA